MENPEMTATGRSRVRKSPMGQRSSTIDIHGNAYYLYDLILA
jgi:hypothetical protein